MPSSVELFGNLIDETMTLIKQADLLVQKVEPVDITKLPVSPNALTDNTTQSLLARCENVCRKHESKKPTIRIIHHLACSGGSLISKCISAMPNVYLLSEVHPFTDLGIGKGKPRYAPSDITQLARYAGIPKQKELSEKLFKKSVDVVHQHVTEMGGILVLRDHTHADFNTNHEIPEESTITKLLKECYEVKSILTIRNPIDSYASLLKNGWVHFAPQTFDEYCRRVLLLIDIFKQENIFKYEDFVSQPQEQMRAMTKALDIPFDDNFENIFGIFKVTGDSGRSSGVIGERKRIVSEQIIQESDNSSNYIGYKNMFTMT